MSPSITEVSPAFGGTSGGTTLTITGSRFGKFFYLKDTFTMTQTIFNLTAVPLTFVI
jgi:hypothetical protein